MMRRALWTLLGLFIVFAGAQAKGIEVLNSSGLSVVITRASYDYVPTAMYDGGRYRIWWCGGTVGDHILYAESDSLYGPWTGPGGQGTYGDVFQPTGNPADFDGFHTCDPSVVNVNGIYYMYYGGLATLDKKGTGINIPTKIGVATSSDGIHWSRGNGGRPIVEPHGNVADFPNKYGAGQPSVVFVGGYFYMIYTDTTGVDSDPRNGAGQYVLRSPDPFVQKNVDELTASGFKRVMGGKPSTRHSLLAAFSTDWAYVDALNAFLVAVDKVPGRTDLYVFSGSLSKLMQSIYIDGAWTEGPGLVRGPHGHALATTQKGVIHLPIFRSVGTPHVPITWDLGYVDAELKVVP
jgi:hypothetical protein